MPKQTRGSRRPKTMFCSSASQVTGMRPPRRGRRLNRIFAVVPGGTDTGPNPVASRIEMAAAKTSNSRMVFIRYGFFMSYCPPMAVVVNQHKKAAPFVFHKQCGLLNRFLLKREKLTISQVLLCFLASAERPFLTAQLQI